jgi:hypothetical protein
MPDSTKGDEGAAIDPRYDRAFQRGFEGEVTTGPRGQSTLRRTAAVNPAPARMPAQVVDRDVDRVAPVEPAPAGQPAPSRTAPESGQGTTSDAATVALPADSAPEPVTSPRDMVRNPFIIALAALGALLILVGSIWAYEGFAAIVKNGGTRNEVEFWAAQTMSFGAPLAIVVGLGVVAVLLVLFGRSYQRSRQ